MIANMHGVEGQLNVCVLDKDSEVTAFGEHARCRVGRETDGERLLVVTADLDAPGSENLPVPTWEQAETLAQAFFVRHTRLQFLGSDEWTSNRGRHVDFNFDVVAG